MEDCVVTGANGVYYLERRGRDTAFSAAGRGCKFPTPAAGPDETA